MVLTVDKGVSMVVMDREDYNTKSEELLQTSTYQMLSTDPTNRHKNKLISLLKSIKAEGGISEKTYKKLYPIGATTPKYYGLPKVHKKDAPLRPIVSSIGSVAYETAKELSRVLKPLAGRSTHHVRNNQDFIQSIEEVTVETEEFICKCRFLILFFHMFSYLFLINRNIFVRETRFQQVLLSSSGPKENIFISKFIYP